MSAAAGSGKTAVLAERCAYLVCDAPPESRCDVDRLLVLTFTEAAAAEMRSRILQAIRRRAASRPDDSRLDRQAALLDAAHVSTIHSFCSWLIRRWFTEVGVEPTVSVQDEAESAVMRSETLAEVFHRLYARLADPDELVGRSRLDRPAPTSRVLRAPQAVGSRTGTWSLGCRDESELAPAFQELVDDYGLGDDRDVSEFVLRLSAYVGSLPDPCGWLIQATNSSSGGWSACLDRLRQTMSVEASAQLEHCRQAAETLSAWGEAGQPYARKIVAYADMLELCQSELEHGSAREAVGEAGRILREFEFPDEKAKALRNPGEGDETRRRTAQGVLEKVKDEFFKDRLRSRFAMFTAEEWEDNLSRTAPYAAVLADLVALFNRAYAARKRRQNVVDFADLERLAFDLLRKPGAPQGADSSWEPSEAAISLHRRFTHVLVDEFQDINPLQEAILRLVSHEARPGSAGNLFVVGDVKQSIYRFRLAEPAVFVDRLRGACNAEVATPPANNPAAANRRAEAHFLRSNFRSRPEILEAVNVVFRTLMRRSLGGIEYDADAELRQGRGLDPAPDRRSVEVHLLQRRWVGRDASNHDGEDAESDGEPEEASQVAFDHPSRWSAAEREAYFIGLKIREWMEADRQTCDDPGLRFSDVAILLRSPRLVGERMASMLAAMGIPARAQVGGSLLAAIEVRDVVSALRVLDNVRQDLPLTAALRSGVFGDRLSEDELARIRLLDRGAAYHACVLRYAREGKDAALRHRVRQVLTTIERYRTVARRRPLSETLWRIYEDDARLACAAALPNGLQRKANLLKLHELSRKFGTFRRQGLHRFLRFLDSLDADDQEIDAASVAGDADDVVRIMSIHQAKGLEFPAVVVAGLGTKFNLRDRTGRMIFEREAGIGLRVVDPERFIEYPSAAHVLAAVEIDRATRQEEMRILYVALTRARDRLMLVGSVDHPDRVGQSPTERLGELSDLTFSTARTPLDWLLPILVHAPSGVVEGLDCEIPRFSDRATEQHAPLFRVALHDEAEMSQWSARPCPSGDDGGVRAAAADLAPLPSDEPYDLAQQEVEEIIRRVEFVYPHLASASVRATVAAGDFKGAHDFLHDPDVARASSRGKQRQAAGGIASEEEAARCPFPRFPAGSSGDSSAAARRGIITHRVLQFLDFAAARDAAGVALELQRLAEGEILTAEDRRLVAEYALEWFVTTPLAQRIRDAGTAYRRELRFVTTEPVSLLDRSVDAAGEDRVLVRGIVDGVLTDRETLEVIDFKTDAIAEDKLPNRCEFYRPQVALYGRAMGRLFRKPVGSGFLVFLAAQRVIPFDGHALRLE